VDARRVASTARTAPVLLRRFIPSPRHARCEVCATCIVFVEHVVRRAPWQLLAAPAAVHREASHEQKRGKEDGDPHRPSTGPRKHLSVK
jgi:hypothetical protein